jgi:hypothetical protein
VPRIVCAVGDPHGVLPHAASDCTTSSVPPTKGIADG